MTTKWLDRRIAAPGPHLALCLYKHELTQAVNHLGRPAPHPWCTKDGMTHVFCNSDPDHGGLVCIVCISNWRGRDPLEIAGLLVHESVHVWQAYADHIGERHEGSEQEAYAIQAIAQELMTEFARRMRDG